MSRDDWPTGLATGHRRSRARAPSSSRRRPPAFAEVVTPAGGQARASTSRDRGRDLQAGITDRPGRPWSEGRGKLAPQRPQPRHARLARRDDLVSDESESSPRRQLSSALTIHAVPTTTPPPVSESRSTAREHVVVLNADDRRCARRGAPSTPRARAKARSAGEPEPHSQCPVRSTRDFRRSRARDPTERLPGFDVRVIIGIRDDLVGKDPDHASTPSPPGDDEVVGREGGFGQCAAPIGHRDAGYRRRCCLFGTSSAEASRSRKNRTSRRDTQRGRPAREGVHCAG